MNRESTNIGQSVDYNEQIWLNDIKILFNPNYYNLNKIIPTDDMKIENQINCITRIIFIVFIILFISNLYMFNNNTTQKGIKYIINSFIFLLISLVLIIFIYNYYKRMYTTENYMSYKKNSLNSLDKSKSTYAKPIYDTKKRVFCDFYNEINPGPNFISKNKQLTGPPHPRTFTKPVIVKPAYDLNSWRDNNNIVFSQINKQTNEDLYYSGVEPATCCGDLENAYLIPDSDYNTNMNSVELPNYIIKQDIIEDFCMGNQCRQNSDSKNKNDKIYNPETFKLTNTKIPEQITHKYGDIIDTLKSEIDIDMETKNIENYPDYPGGVNRQCGYNPTQVHKSNLPSNYPASNCEQSSNMSNYNKNLFTNIIQPGVYYNSDVIEPINSNIGISFNQQFQPTTCQINRDGSFLYKAHDPSMVNVVNPNSKDDIINEISNDNIYDPRLTGYGTSYRTYNHDITGQTRFMYDDIDAIRMPNYITRSNIDFLPYADSYGPLKAGEEFGNTHNSNIRTLAQDSWLRNSLQFRDDLTVLRSRKQMAREWQQKIAPIHTRNTKAVSSKRV